MHIKPFRPFDLAALLLTAIAPSLGAQATAVVLVRHAEKASAAGDPDLSAPGQARAEALSAVLAAFPVQAIFVSQYRRTLQTAAPTAEALHVVPVAIPVADGLEAHAAAMAAAIRGLPPRSAALVVGHSNTLGPIIKALGGPLVPDLCDAEYATIFVLEMPPGKPVRLLRANFGAPDPPEAVVCGHDMRLH
jgi:broad specificity phosphatase PhoE